MDSTVGDKLWNNLEKALAQGQNISTAPLPPLGFSYYLLKKIIFIPALALLLIAISLFWVYSPKSRDGQIISEYLTPDSRKTALSLPLENYAISSGNHSLKFSKDSLFNITLMPRTQILFEKLSIGSDNPRLEARLKLIDGAIYVRIKSETLKEKNLFRKSPAILWQVKTTAGLVQAIGTTFFVRHNEQEGSTILLKEGRLLFKVHDQSAIFPGPEMARLDKKIYLSKQNPESQKEIKSFFRKLEKQISGHIVASDSGALIELESDNWLRNLRRQVRMHEYPNPEIGPNMPDKKIPPVRIKIFLKNGMVLIGEIKKSAKGKIFLITDEGEFSIYVKDIKKKIILN
jgi:hypothetical protein